MGERTEGAKKTIIAVVSFFITQKKFRMLGLMACSRSW